MSLKEDIRHFSDNRLNEIKIGGIDYDDIMPVIDTFKSGFLSGLDLLVNIAQQLKNGNKRQEGTIKFLGGQLKQGMAMMVDALSDDTIGSMELMTVSDSFVRTINKALMMSHQTTARGTSPGQEYIPGVNQSEPDSERYRAGTNRKQMDQAYSPQFHRSLTQSNPQSSAPVIVERRHVQHITPTAIKPKIARAELIGLHEETQERIHRLKKEGLNSVQDLVRLSIDSDQTRFFEEGGSI